MEGKDNRHSRSRNRYMYQGGGGGEEEEGESGHPWRAEERRRKHNTPSAAAAAAGRQKMSSSTAPLAQSGGAGEGGGPRYHHREVPPRFQSQKQQTKHPKPAKSSHTVNKSKPMKESNRWNQPPYSSQSYHPTAPHHPNHPHSSSTHHARPDDDGGWSRGNPEKGSGWVDDKAATSGSSTPSGSGWASPTAAQTQPSSSKDTSGWGSPTTHVQPSSKDTSGWGSPTTHVQPSSKDTSGWGSPTTHVQPSSKDTSGWGSPTTHVQPSSKDASGWGSPTTHVQPSSKDTSGWGSPTTHVQPSSKDTSGWGSPTTHVQPSSKDWGGASEVDSLTANSTSSGGNWGAVSSSGTKARSWVSSTAFNTDPSTGTTNISAGDSGSSNSNSSGAWGVPPQQSNSSSTTGRQAQVDAWNGGGDVPKSGSVGEGKREDLPPTSTGASAWGTTIGGGVVVGSNWGASEDLESELAGELGCSAGESYPMEGGGRERASSRREYSRSSQQDTDWEDLDTVSLSSNERDSVIHVQPATTTGASDSASSSGDCNEQGGRGHTGDTSERTEYNQQETEFDSYETTANASTRSTSARNHDSLYPPSSNSSSNRGEQILSPMNGHTPSGSQDYSAGPSPTGFVGSQEQSELPHPRSASESGPTYASTAQSGVRPSDVGGGGAGTTGTWPSGRSSVGSTSSVTSAGSGGGGGWKTEGGGGGGGKGGSLRGYSNRSSSPRKMINRYERSNSQSGPSNGAAATGASSAGLKVHRTKKPTHLEDAIECLQSEPSGWGDLPTPRAADSYNGTELWGVPPENRPSPAKGKTGWDSTTPGMEWGSEDTSGALTAGWGQSAKEMGVADPRMGVATPGGGGPQWGGTPTSDDWSSVVKHKDKTVGAATDNLKKLVDMGFSYQTSQQSLKANNNDLESALAELLAHSSLSADDVSGELLNGTTFSSLQNGKGVRPHSKALPGFVNPAATTSAGGVGSSNGSSGKESSSSIQQQQLATLQMMGLQSPGQPGSVPAGASSSQAQLFAQMQLLQIQQHYVLNQLQLSQHSSGSGSSSTWHGLTPSSSSSSSTSSSSSSAAASLQAYQQQLNQQLAQLQTCKKQLIHQLNLLKSAPAPQSVGVSSTQQKLSLQLTQVNKNIAQVNQQLMKAVQLACQQKDAAFKGLDGGEKMPPTAMASSITSTMSSSALRGGGKMGAGEAVSKPPGGLMRSQSTSAAMNSLGGGDVSKNLPYSMQGLALGSGGGGNLSNATQSSSARSISRLHQIISGSSDNLAGLAGKDNASPYGGNTPAIPYGMGGGGGGGLTMTASPMSTSQHTFSPPPLNGALPSHHAPRGGPPGTITVSSSSSSSASPASFAAPKSFDEIQEFKPGVLWQPRCQPTEPAQMYNAPSTPGGSAQSPVKQAFGAAQSMHNAAPGSGGGVNGKFLSGNRSYYSSGGYPSGTPTGGNLQPLGLQSNKYNRSNSLRGESRQSSWGGHHQTPVDTNQPSPFNQQQGHSFQQRSSLHGTSSPMTGSGSHYHQQQQQHSGGSFGGMPRARKGSYQQQQGVSPSTLPSSNGLPLQNTGFPAGAHLQFGGVHTPTTPGQPSEMSGGRKWSSVSDNPTPTSSVSSIGNPVWGPSPAPTPDSSDHQQHWGQDIGSSSSSKNFLWKTDTPSPANSKNLRSLSFSGGAEVPPTPSSSSSSSSQISIAAADAYTSSSSSTPTSLGSSGVAAGNAWSQESPGGRGRGGGRSSAGGGGGGARRVGGTLLSPEPTFAEWQAGKKARLSVFKMPGSAPSQWLVIKNITTQIDEPSLRDVCSEYGQIQSIHHSVASELAVIQYASEDVAIQAKLGLDKNPTICDVIVSVDFASSSDVAIFLEATENSAQEMASAPVGSSHSEPASTPQSAWLSKHINTTSDNTLPSTSEQSGDSTSFSGDFNPVHHPGYPPQKSAATGPPLAARDGGTPAQDAHWMEGGFLSGLSSPWHSGFEPGRPTPPPTNTSEGGHLLRHAAVSANPTLSTYLPNGLL